MTNKGTRIVGNQARKIKFNRAQNPFVHLINAGEKKEEIFDDLAKKTRKYSLVLSYSVVTVALGKNSQEKSTFVRHT